MSALLRRTGPSHLPSLAAGQGDSSGPVRRSSDVAIVHERRPGRGNGSHPRGPGDVAAHFGRHAS